MRFYFNFKYHLFSMATYPSAAVRLVLRSKQNYMFSVKAFWLFWLTIGTLFGFNYCKMDEIFYVKWIEKYRNVSGNRNPPLKYKEWIRLAQELNVSTEPSEYKQIFSDLTAFKYVNLTVEYIEKYGEKIKNLGREIHIRSMKEMISVSRQGKWEFGASLLHISRVIDPEIDFKCISHVCDEGMSMPDENKRDEPYKSMADVFERNRQVRKLHKNNRNKVMLLQAPTSFLAVPFNVTIFGASRTRGFKDILMPTTRTGLPVYETKFHIWKEPVPWEQKSNKAMFRGTSTGIDFKKTESDDINLTICPRIKLHEMTMLQKQGKLNCSVELDFGITAYRYLDENRSSSYANRIKSKFPVVNELNFEAQFQSKYLVVVDGNAWPDRLALYMASGSLVFLSTTQDEWVINQVTDGENCIIVKPDLSDLVEKLEWAANNDAEAGRIARNGRKLAFEKFGLKNMQAYNAFLFMEYQNLFKK